MCVPFLLDSLDRMINVNTFQQFVTRLDQKVLRDIRNEAMRLACHGYAPKTNFKRPFNIEAPKESQSLNPGPWTLEL